MNLLLIGGGLVALWYMSRHGGFAGLAAGGSVGSNNTSNAAGQGGAGATADQHPPTADGSNDALMRDLFSGVGSAIGSIAGHWSGGGGGGGGGSFPSTEPNTTGDTRGDVWVTPPDGSDEMSGNVGTNGGGDSFFNSSNDISSDDPGMTNFM